MIDCVDLKKIAETRLKESRVLFNAGCYDGCVYLAGYVVEVSLKAVVCKNLKIQEYPDNGAHKEVFNSHNFDRLLLLSGLSKRISATNRRNQKLFKNWSILTQWKPEGRYTPIGTYSVNNATDYLDALDGTHGFFKFIKKVW